MPGHTVYLRTSAQSAEATRGIWGHAPQEILEALRLVCNCYRIGCCANFQGQRHSSQYFCGIRKTIVC